MDASGRPEAGFVYGNNLWIGSHGQCKDISNTKPLEINHEKIGREATAHEYPPYTMGFTMVYLRHNSTLQHHTQLPLEHTLNT
ncbi:hypothetical protein NQ318_013698 [Aromia moschata]|uniref:Nose resistant-to-fluoxetine protein N-terminal domain-containing protein n=1 Tax=Aromia moschata TaxID=1265417 RepID=A0AAV8ZA96_9CUCU|nr:hypothetical protein NQ318_013698 [Aromia moschata]